jgi:hypothetical protein
VPIIMPSRIIHIQPDAPRKPSLGQPCNGCAVCCLYEPCPLGWMLSRRRRGACVAVRWDGAGARYRCGALTEPARVLLAVLPPMLSRFVPTLARLLPRFAGRWIAAGQGCDCDLAVDGPESDRQSAA